MRPATAADLPRLTALEAACFADPWPAQTLGGLLTDPWYRLWVHPAGPAGSSDPTSNADVRCYAILQVVADEAELQRIGTQPEARGRGFARALLGEILNTLKEAGVRRCFLEVREDNVAAQALYLALGFTPSGRRRDYYGPGQDALLLTRELG